MQLPSFEVPLHTVVSMTLLVSKYIPNMIVLYYDSFLVYSKGDGT